MTQLALIIRGFSRRCSPGNVPGGASHNFQSPNADADADADAGQSGCCSGVPAKGAWPASPANASTGPHVTTRVDTHEGRLPGIFGASPSRHPLQPWFRHMSSSPCLLVPPSCVLTNFCKHGISSLSTSGFHRQQHGSSTSTAALDGLAQAESGHGSDGRRDTAGALYAAEEKDY